MRFKVPRDHRPQPLADMGAVFENRSISIAETPLAHTRKGIERQRRQDERVVVKAHVVVVARQFGTPEDVVREEMAHVAITALSRRQIRHFRRNRREIDEGCLHLDARRPPRQLFRLQIVLMENEDIRRRPREKIPFQKREAAF